MNVNTQPNNIAPWRLALRQNFTSWTKLADFLMLSAEKRKTIEPKASFPLNMPLRLAEKVKKNQLNDPILKQFLPTLEERQRHPDFVQDPTQDISFHTSNRLLKKYHARALLISTGACAMHCRYCFRQNFDYPVKTPYEESLEAIEKDTSLREIILSGGDPLSLSNEDLGAILKRLDSMAHIKRIRFHTRFPVGIPERIDHGFLQLLAASSKQIWFVTHINHPAELDCTILAALKSISRLGIPVLNQTVLLKDINDEIGTLQTLCETLADHGILPYYLHQLDRVSGAMHFEVAEEIGLELVEQLKQNLSGYAVPKYVKEIAGDKYKRSIQ